MVTFGRRFGYWEKTNIVVWVQNYTKMFGIISSLFLAAFFAGLQFAFAFWLAGCYEYRFNFGK